MINPLKLILKKKTAEVVPPETSTPGATTPPKIEEVAPQKPFIEGLVSTKDIIAPASIEVDFNNIRIDNRFYRTLFMVINRRFVEVNWLSSLINFDASINTSMYIYPTDGKEILDDLRRKITEMEAEISTDIQKGRIVDPATQAKLEDALTLQADLVKGEERFFQMGLYVTLTAETVEDLDKVTKNLQAGLGALMVIAKPATLQMEDGFITTLPIGLDKLGTTRNMDTTSLATTFPFVSSDLSDDKGVMFGINEHNGSLVIFDRFSMPNYNSVVFATAGAGKSYMIKLEAIRSLMLGTEVIVIDPENEYRDLCEAVGGQYIAFGYGEASKINPFDLSLVEEEGENALNTKILALHKLFKIMLGEMNPIEESILDRAIMDAYKMKGITPDPETQKKEAPLIEDLYKSLIGMESKEAQNIAARMEKYIKGSFAGIFNQKTTVNLTNPFVVFGIRNLEDSLRPIAMQIVLDYIWTVVKRELKKRIMIVDEAWYLMQYPDSASFLRGIVKRGRKYYLGVTTITQDVDDFLATPYGKEIVTNSSIQILLKQHSAAIDQVGEVFYLSEGEKQLLLSADKGEGIFFAGQNHVAIRVIASQSEHKLITSNPEEVMRMKQQAAALKLNKLPEIKPVMAVGEEKNKISGLDKKSNMDEVTVNDKKATILPVTMEDKTVDRQMVSPPPTASQSGGQAAPAPAQNGQLYRAEVVEDTANNQIETALERKIAEMEVEEKKKVDDHKTRLVEEQKKADEEKQKAGGLGGVNSGLPKYQDLFKSFSSGGKLPPLPPLPKFEPPKTPPEVPLKPTVEFKPIIEENKKPEDKAPVFVPKTNEVKIPQPPQLVKKNEPVFEKKEETKPEETKPIQKLNYDDLFGNGIV